MTSNSRQPPQLRPDESLKARKGGGDSFFFGLDPLLRTFVRMFACDVHQLSARSSFPGGFALESHQLTKALIVGHVVAAAMKVGSKQSFAKYVIDDGTASITCVLWEGKTGCDPGPGCALVNQEGGVGDIIVSAGLGSSTVGSSSSAFRGGADFGESILFESASSGRSGPGLASDESSTSSWHTLFPLGSLVEVRGTIKAFSPMWTEKESIPPETQLSVISIRE